MQPKALVIGGGPAGCAAALWLHQLEHSVLLIEAESTLGGLQCRNPYPNHWMAGVPGVTGQEYAQRLQRHLETAQCPFVVSHRVISLNRVDDRWNVEAIDASAQRKQWSAEWVLLATGTRPSSGGLTASAQLAIGPGAPTEALNVAGRRVAVLGGGDNAFDQAAMILERGAAEVVLFSRSQPRAFPSIQKKVPSNLVRVGAYQVDDRRLTVNGQSFDAISVQYGFEAMIPASVKECLLNGYVKVDAHGKTALPNLYACGDATYYLHPAVVTALAHGAHVANYLASQILSK